MFSAAFSFSLSPVTVASYSFHSILFSMTCAKITWPLPHAPATYMREISFTFFPDTLVPAKKLSHGP